MFKKLLTYIKPYKKYAIGAPLMMVLEVAADIIIPSLMASLVDDGLLVGDRSYIIRTGLIMILVALFGLFNGSVSAYLGATAGFGTAANLQQDAYRAIQSFSFTNIDEISEPSLITRLTSDINIIGQVVMMSTRMAFRAPFLLIFALVFSFRINRQLARIFLFTIPIGAFFIFIIFRQTVPYFMKMRDRTDDINEVTRDQITGIREIKAFNRMSLAQKIFSKRNEGYRDTAIKGFNSILRISPLMTLMIYGTMLAVLRLGGAQIYEGTMQAGTIMAFLTYVAQVAVSLMMMSNYIINLLYAKISFRRVFEVLETHSEIKEKENPIQEVPDGSIRFEDVCFSYTGHACNILNDINFQIESGSQVGIIGGTGSGKTSLVQLIPRLYDVDQGAVYVGGHNVKDYDIEKLRQSIGFVLQKNRLVSGTIRSNMQWGDPEASDEEIVKALKQAQAWEFVSTYSDGLDHVVEQGGSNFSGGQKQRLTLARAFLTKPKILIMDDATSAVDMDTDAKIRKTIREDLSGITTIIIAQRIESIMDMDMIIILEEGKIDAIGSHEELLKTSSIYQEIYESQMGGLHD